MEYITVKLLFLFLPGLLCFLFIEQLVPNNKIETHRVIIYSAILGFINYLVFYLIISLSFLVSRTNGNATWDMFNYVSTNNSISYIVTYKEVLWTSIISIVTGLIISAAINYKILHRLCLWLKITQKVAEQNIWCYIMESNSRQLQLVRIRDFAHGLIYEGRIDAYDTLISEYARGIVLTNVTIYEHPSGEKIENLFSVYLNYVPQEMVLEFPFVEEEENKNEEK